MWIADQSKEQFLDMLRLENTPSDVVSEGHTWNVEKVLPRGTVRLIWSHPPENGVVPALLVIPAGEWREFFAWSNTYLGGWRPISGLFRVIADRNLWEVLGDKSNHEAIWEYRNAALGMIFGEAAVHAVLAKNGARDTKWTFAGCMETCSFAMGRAMYLGRSDLATAAQNWHRARVVTHQASADDDVQDLLEPWSVLLEVVGLSTSTRCGTHPVSEAVVAICRTLHRHDEIDKAALAVLIRDWPTLEEAFRSMNEARERRVHALEVALKSVGERRGRFSQSAIVALGLLASRIAPGSIDHAALLRPYVVRMRGLMLWYGLFSGMTHAARLVDNYESLGRRILRDMLVEDTVFSRPSCDIAIDELETIFASESLLQNIPRATAEQLVIEILPCVNTIAPYLKREERATLTQRGLFDDDARRLESDVRDFSHAAERLIMRLRRLSTNRY